MKPPFVVAALAAFAFLPVVHAQIGNAAYPTRPPGDPAAIARGQSLYGVNCQFCHGADTRGGDSGPSLLRASVVLDDRDGELIGPVVTNGRVERGMPKFAFTPSQIGDVVAFIHSFQAFGYDESRQKPPSIIVGSALAGQTFFNARCASCHATTGDLRGVATRIADQRLLQQTWLMPGSGRGGRLAMVLPPVTVTVTLPTGEKVEGRLDRIDDFTVSLIGADGTPRSFRTVGGSPKVEIHDPLQPHKDLLRIYSDTDIHNVTAYLVTLK